MKILHYNDKNGKIIGWYDKQIHKNIPIPNIEIPENIWKEAISNNYNFINLENNILSKKDFRTEELKIKQKTTTILNKVLNYMDEEAISLGFTGDNKTRPYRAIANYVGYDNRYRESAEKLGRWIADVFGIVENFDINDIANIDLENIKDYLPKLEDY